MVMTTINTVSASAEGVGLSQIEAFKTAIESVVSVVKKKVQSNETVDFASAEILEEVQSNATTIAGSKGADTVAMHRTLDAANRKNEIN